MANVAHSTLSGADLHEPKGIASATASTVYIADGVGSGAWSSGATLIGITGQIADFATPAVPTGWLECDGTQISRSTYASLFTALTVQQTGSKTNGSAIITGLSSTTNMRAGYLIGGTGITNGTTIATVDSATQVTMSAVATATNSATVIVSPWALGDGSTTFTLPNTATAGRYRRSRFSTTVMGTSQTELTNLISHTHTQQGAFTSGVQSVGHTHTQGGTFTSGGESNTHTHPTDDHISGAPAIVTSATGQTLGFGTVNQAGTTGSNAGTDHSHNVTISGQTGTISADHTHSTTISGATTGPSTTGAETRPITLVVLTCIKT